MSSPAPPCALPTPEGTDLAPANQVTRQTVGELRPRPPRIIKVYTRTGDDGSTGLGGGQQGLKTAEGVEAYGTVHELNSALGLARNPRRAGCKAGRGAGEDPERALLHLGSDLCILEEDKKKWPVLQIEERHVKALEEN